MAYSSSKKLEIVSRLIEQRIPAQMAYRMMGLKDNNQVLDVVINQNAKAQSDEKILTEYRQYKPKNTIINEDE